MNTFKQRLDKLWKDQECKYNYRGAIDTGTSYSVSDICENPVLIPMEEAQEEQPTDLSTVV